MSFFIINTFSILSLCLVLLAPNYRIPDWQYAAALCLVVVILINGYFWGFHEGKKS